MCCGSKLPASVGGLLQVLPQALRIPEERQEPLRVPPIQLATLLPPLTGRTGGHPGHPVQYRRAPRGSISLLCDLEISLRQSSFSRVCDVFMQQFCYWLKTTPSHFHPSTLPTFWHLYVHPSPIFIQLYHLHSTCKDGELSSPFFTSIFGDVALSP